MLQKWQIPHNLCAEVVQAFKQQEGEGDVILDLFSGGESYRKAVEAAGLTYIAIDLKTMERTDEQKQAEAKALSDQITKR